MVNNPKQDFRYLGKEEELLPSLSRWVNWSGLFILGTVGVVVTIASVFKYNVTVQAPASIRPIGELRIVQPGIEGLVKQILVKENQEVKKGSVLVILDDSQLQIQKSQLENHVQQYRLQLFQINAQIRAQNTQILAETEKSSRTLISARAELTRSRRDYRDKQITTQADAEEGQTNVRSIQQKLEKTQIELKADEAKLRGSQTALESAIVKRNRYQEITKQGAFSQDQYEEAKLAVLQQQENVEVQKVTLKAQRKLIDQYQQDLVGAIAKWRRVKAFLNPDLAEVTIATEKVAQEKATINALLATLEKEREELLQQEIIINQQITSDLQELEKVKIQLERTFIKAPVEGLIFRITLRNPGQTVQSNSEIAQIVPRHTLLTIKSLVSSQDISKIQVGQKTQFKVSACPYPDYGTLKGKVKEISSDTIPQINAKLSPSINQASQALYEVIIEPESLSLGAGKNRCIIQLGMDGKVDIVTSEETIFQYLLRKARLISDF
jgi:multidrug efflux pump subunit AcrA (membrane-fusion protein)